MVAFLTCKAENNHHPHLKLQTDNVDNSPFVIVSAKDYVNPPYWENLRYNMPNFHIVNALYIKTENIIQRY